MKFLNKILFLILVLGIGTSCEDLELDKLDSPNIVSPDQANVDDLFNQLQLDFTDVVEQADFFGGVMSRMRHSSGGFTYNAVFAPTSFNFLWQEAYSGMFPDVDKIIELASERGLTIHIGASKILKAYAMMVLVDIFGDVPYTEAGQGISNLSPIDDTGESGIRGS